MNSYLNLEEAISLTGLNEKTLLRFITAGYIQTREEDQLILLSIPDLNKTFGLNVPIPQIREESDLQIEVTTLNAELPKAQDFIIEQIADSESELTEKSPKTHLKIKTEESILEKVIALQDRLIEDKEAQLGEQQKEIKWLRTRIEKLEEQSEKDKILLLSGNQTINRLIELSGQKRGWFGRTLTWLGSKEP